MLIFVGLCAIIVAILYPKLFKSVLELIFLIFLLVVAHTVDESYKKNHSGVASSPVQTESHRQYSRDKYFSDDWR